MVFSEYINNFFKKDNDTQQINDRAIYALEQGLNHLKSKRHIIKKNKIGNRIEGFKTPKQLTDATDKELKILKDLEQEYNISLSQYSKEHKDFLEEYLDSKKNHTNCQKNCMVKYKGMDQQSIRLRESCTAGCDIKGPYLVQCSNTYKGWFQNTNKKCGELTNGKCINGKIEPGQDSYISNSKWRDIDYSTLKAGCCSCGGGKGGPPTADVRSSKVRNCDNIYSAFGLMKGQSFSKPLINACKTSKYKDQYKSANLYQKYNSLKSKNDDLMKKAQDIYGKINKLKTIKTGVKKILKREEKRVENQLSNYSNTYSEIVGLDKSGSKESTTLKAQTEDMMMKEQSEQLKYMAWIILALFASSFTIKKLFEKI
jgi:hypothetical protein